MEQLIKMAITEKRLVEFYYHGHQRIAEPHVFGINGGIKQVLAYQVRGYSSSGMLPDWRRFDLHEISRLSVLDETFPGQRPSPSGKHSKWDRQIIVVS